MLGTTETYMWTTLPLVEGAVDILETLGDWIILAQPMFMQALLSHTKFTIRAKQQVFAAIYKTVSRRPLPLN
jgi:hypothetical protein